MELVSFKDMQAMAKALAFNKMFGKTEPEALALMILAQAQGRHPAIVATEYDIIQGKPAINSKSALSRFQRAGGKIQWLERSDLKASAKFIHESGGELVIEWDMNRARQAQLTGKENWKKYPAQMLSARVIAEGVRAVCPACLDGMYTSEEVGDFDQPKRQPVATEATVVDDDIKQLSPDPLDTRVDTMLKYMESKGISEKAVLKSVNKIHFSFIDEEDLEKIKFITDGAKEMSKASNESFNVVLKMQFPEPTSEVNSDPVESAPELGISPETDSSDVNPDDLK